MPAISRCLTSILSHGKARSQLFAANRERAGADALRDSPPLGSIYNAGQPAWVTADNTGCWLTTHTPPTSAAVVPGSRTVDGQPLVFLGAFVAVGGHGLQWLHEDGTKVGGQGWVGGTWTGAPTLAIDLGPQAVADHLCYVGSVWEGELRLTAKTRALADQPLLKLKLGEDVDQGKTGAVAGPRAAPPPAVRPPRPAPYV